MTSPRHEFTAEAIAELLAELGARLRQREVSASIFVVGGDKALARERGLPETG